jgi:signal transduction histidine kinase
MTTPVRPPFILTLGSVLVSLSTLMCSGSVANSVDETEPKRVLLLHRTDLLLPATVEQDQITRKAIAAAVPHRVEFHSEGFDIVRLSGPADGTELLSLLLKKYAARPPHLIIAHGPMQDIIAQNRARLWPGTPMMFAGIAEDRVKDPGFPRGIPGTTIRLDLRGTAQLAMTMQPEARRLVIIAGNSEYDLKWRQRAAVALQPYRDRIAVEFVTDRTVEELEHFVASLSRDTIMIFTTLYRDAANRVFVSREVAQRLSAVSSAPIYTLYPSQVGRGAVGGAVQDWNAQGDAIGDIARRLLAGERPESLPLFTPSPPVCKLDWRQLQRWGIAVNLAPKTCQILFRAPTFWSQYRTEAVFIGLIVLIMSALIVALLTERHSRQRAEIEAERQRGELAHASRLTAIGALSASIAHEINQPLFAILSNVVAAEVLLKSDHPRLAEIGEILGDIRRDDERASEVIAKVRELLQRRPVEMHSLPANEIVNSILRFVAGACRVRGVIITTELADALPPIQGDRVQLEQVVLNLVMNAIEAMADAATERRHLTVRTVEMPRGSVEISVRDSGAGIPEVIMPKLFDAFFSTKHDGMGLGLSIARSIVTAHGGRIWAQTCTDGATLFFTIPVSHAVDEIQPDADRSLIQARTRYG